MRSAVGPTPKLIEALQAIKVTFVSSAGAGHRASPSTTVALHGAGDTASSTHSSVSDRPTISAYRRGTLKEDYGSDLYAACRTAVQLTLEPGGHWTRQGAERALSPLFG